MREIKFRAWADGCIHSPDYTTVLIGLRGFIQDENYVLMQFTGLCDKNGKEIYEGDIVRGWVPDNEKDEDFERMIIKFDEAEFFIARPDCRTAKSGLYFGSLSPCVLNNSIEVIGNIYENQELLEAEKKEKT